MPSMRHTLKKPFFICLAIWFIVAALAIYIRCYPFWGHIWSPTQEVATMGVVYKLKQNYLAQVHAQQPQLSPEEATQIATVKLNETLRLEKKNITRAIERANNELYKQSGLSNNIYLLEADPFYFYHLTENINQTGKLADVIKGHQYFNNFMGAPFGFWQPLSLHPYVGFLVFKVSQFFIPTIKLMEAAAITPLFLTILIIGAFIWNARLFGLSLPIIAITSLYFAMLPVFLKRSALGWYDTDPYNLLFMLTFFGIVLKNLTAISIRQTIFWACLLSFNLILFSLIWQGWIFLFFLTIIAAVIIGLTSFFLQKNRTIYKQQITFLCVFLCLTTVLGLLIYGYNGFFTFFTEGSQELGKFTNKGLNLWPNLFMEVGELKKSTLNDLLKDTGGPIFLSISIFGCALAIFNMVRKLKNHLQLRNILLLSILLITSVLTFKANRFVIFMLLPLSLFFGYALQIISEYTQKFPFSKIIKISCAIFLIGWCWMESNINIRTVLTPIFNDVWNDNLSAIRTLTPKDAIINTWWPPGHFIKAIANRRVMFDGASLSEAQTGFWMAKALLSNNEHEAKGILRMLNLSGNKATAFLLDRKFRTSDAVDLLTRLAPLSLTDAQVQLHGILNTQDTEALLKLTHATMPHSYLLLYNEIIESNIGIVFVGRRDFRKMEAINDNPKLLEQAPKPNTKEYIDFLWDLSGGPSKFSAAFSLINMNENGLMFAPGLFVTKDYTNAQMNSNQYGHGQPQSIMYLKNGEIIDHKIPNGNLPYSIVLYEQDQQLMCRLMDTSIANSLMMKLYFFNGEGMKNFKLIKSSNDLTGRTHIKTFQAY